MNFCASLISTLNFSWNRIKKLFGPAYLLLPKLIEHWKICYALDLKLGSVQAMTVFKSIFNSMTDMYHTVNGITFYK